MNFLRPVVIASLLVLSGISNAMPDSGGTSRGEMAPVGSDLIVGTWAWTRLPRRWLLRARIAAVIHPLGEFEGGLTQVEYRALRELCFVSGAHATAVHEGAELTAAELAAFDFAASDTPAQ
ncbi:hypothetical protein [Salinisphaera sp. S4-8]|uniref:hypothetical protein n=1 Tax=Salinisphaera sp. S4-8 TaxID=633357 RepID=UPI0033422579